MSSSCFQLSVDTIHPGQSGPVGHSRLRDLCAPRKCRNRRAVQFPPVSECGNCRAMQSRDSPPVRSLPAPAPLPSAPSPLPAPGPLPSAPMLAPLAPLPFPPPAPPPMLAPLSSPPPPRARPPSRAPLSSARKSVAPATRVDLGGLRLLDNTPSTPT